MLHPFCYPNITYIPQLKELAFRTQELLINKDYKLGEII